MAHKSIKQLFILLLAGCALLPAFVAAQTALQPGAATSFTLQPGYFIANYYIDIDASAQQLSVSTSGSGGDVDLFVRYASPFPQPGYAPLASNYPVSEDLLYRYSHYHSTSSSTNESIIVLPSSRIPLGIGRWYITIINGGSAGATGTLTARTYTAPQPASITVDFNSPVTASDPKNSCETAPWSDSTAATPVGSNPGTTLGQQRQNALNHAAALLAAQLQLSVPLTVHACWAHLGGDANKAILAHASPLTYLFDEAASGGYVLPKRYTWYAITEAVRLGGTTQCGLLGGSCDGPDNEQIEAVFNEDIGTAGVIGGEPFYYGYDSDPNGNSLDFISIAMHELTHGLGFLGLVNVDATLGPLGARAGIAKDSSGQSTIAWQNLTVGPYDDVFDTNLAIVDSGNTTYTPFLGYETTAAPRDAQRAAALTSGVDGSGDVPTLLRWSEATAINSSANELVGQAAPRSFPSVYAPCHGSPCATVPGSTLSHTVQYDDLMNAYYPRPAPRTMGLALPMLAPLGWSNTLATMPTFAHPIQSSWYDRAHSGTGIDFRLVARDAVFGDVYFMAFYTYKADGTTEWYTAQGHLVDGVFTPDLDSNGSTLSRYIYHANQTPRSTLDASISGGVILDFNQAANAPECRNLDRSGASMLGIMSWKFVDPSTGTVKESGTWCIEPLIGADQHPTPDYNGTWYAGSNDSRWGLVILDVNRGSANQLVAALYYPDPNGQPLWALANLDAFANDQSIPLMQPNNGFCRTCPVPSGGVKYTQVGTLSLHLTQATNEGSQPSGANTVTLQANYPGGGSFSRTNTPITLISVPTGQ